MRLSLPCCFITSRRRIRDAYEVAGNIETELASPPIAMAIALKNEMSTATIWCQHL